MDPPSPSQFPPGCRSPDEFPVKDSQNQDVVRVASYFRRDFSLAVTRLDPGETDPHRTSLVAPFPQAPAADLGALERLPVEILHEVVRLLDIASAFSLGQVSRRSRQAVAATPEYGFVGRHALDALRVVLRTGLAGNFTALDLCRAVRARDCEQCGDFGGFVFLPELSRCCFRCVPDAPGLHVTTATKYYNFTGLTAARARKSGVPIVHTLQGAYGFSDEPSRQRFNLIATRSSLQAHNRHGLAGFALLREKLVYRYMAVTALPFVDPETLEAQHGVCCKGCYIAESKHPLSERGADWRCSNAKNQVYSHEGFIRHFAWCAEAQALWVSSQEGTVSIEDPEFIRKGGFLTPWYPGKPTLQDIIRASKRPLPRSA